MSALFLRLLNLSIKAGWLVLALVAVRPLLKKAPAWVKCAMWGAVGLRLTLPFSLKTSVSLVPSAETVPEAILTSPEPRIDSGIPAVNEAVLVPGIDHGGFLADLPDPARELKFRFAHRGPPGIPSRK